MATNANLAKRLAAAMKARGLYRDVQPFRGQAGLQYTEAVARINAATPDLPPMDVTTLRRIVVNQTDPAVSTLVRICKGLDIPFDELLGDEPDDRTV